MNRIIYIVRGSSGSYADYGEWDVVAYTDEERAEEHVRDAQLYADKHDNDRRVLMATDYMEAYAAYKYENPFDPECSGGSWSDEVDYEVVELELIEEEEDKLLSSPSPVG